MKIKTGLVAGMAMAGVFANAAMFEITWTNHGPQPLSPLFFSASDNTFDTFQVGGTASLGIKKIAEGGDTSSMNDIAMAAGSAVSTYGMIGSSPLGPGGTRTMMFETDAAHPYFSFAAMLGKTNDGFIGESVSSMGWDVFSGDMSLDIFGARAWDAGTELNTQNAADLGFLGGSGNPADTDSNLIRVHGGIIPNVGDSWDQMPAWQQDTLLSTVTVNAVPEPATMSVLALGALALLKRRKK